MGYNNVAEQWTTDPVKLARLFADLADTTDPDQDTRLSTLAGKLPCIAHYATKTQLDILRALLVKMSAKAWPGDRMVRVHGGVYRWQCRNWALA